MKRAILLVVGFLFLASFARAQVLFNFNKGTVSGVEKSTDSDGGGDNPVTGPGLDSLYWAHGPANSANGVCAIALHWDSTGQHGRMELGSAGSARYVAAKGAKFITFWIYLDSAQNIPDSLQIDTYAMDNTNWSWTEDIFFAKDIPHNVWYPLAFPLAAHKASNSNFAYDNTADGKGFMTGLQFFPHNENSVGWHGIIYVDNISLVGTLPHNIAGVTGGTSGYEKSTDSDGGGDNPVTGPGLDSVFAAADPAGGGGSVMGMALHWDSTGQHARMDLGSAGNSTYFAGKDYQFVTFMVYLDSAQNIPDSLQIDTYAMDNVNWSWTEDIHFARDIPHDVWYPLSFPLAAHKAMNPNFDYNNKADGKGFMTGLQIFPHDTASVGWEGVIYVGKTILSDTIASIPPPVWVAANFEKVTGNGLQGFYVPGYASGKLTNIWDINTPNGSNVLQAAVNFGAAPHKFAAVRDTIPMQDADSIAMSVSFQMFLPATVPAGGTVQFYVSGGAGDSVAVVKTIGDAGMKPGQWNTMSILKLDSLAGEGKFDPTKPAQVGVMISYPGDTASWAGNLLFDNLTVTGIWFPDQIATGVQSGNVVKSFRLYNNYPNPFNPSTVIQYDVPKTAKVVIRVYDILGREVTTLVNARQAAGTYKINLNMSKHASGVYFVRMDAGSYLKTQKMMLLK